MKYLKIMLFVFFVVSIISVTSAEAALSTMTEPAAKLAEGWLKEVTKTTSAAVTDAVAGANAALIARAAIEPVLGSILDKYIDPTVGADFSSLYTAISGATDVQKKLKEDTGLLDKIKDGIKGVTNLGDDQAQELAEKLKNKFVANAWYFSRVISDFLNDMGTKTKITVSDIERAIVNANNNKRGASDDEIVDVAMRDVRDVLTISKEDVSDETLGDMFKVAIGTMKGLSRDKVQDLRGAIE